jgi:hypothetical protein
MQDMRGAKCEMTVVRENENEKMEERDKAEESPVTVSRLDPLRLDFGSNRAYVLFTLCHICRAFITFLHNRPATADDLHPSATVRRRQHSAMAADNDGPPPSATFVHCTPYEPA